MIHLTNTSISRVAALAGCAAVVLSGFLCGCSNGDAKPETEAHLDRGEKYLDNGDYDAAVAAFKKAITIQPDYARAYLGRAVAYNLKGADFHRIGGDAHCRNQKRPCNFTLAVKDCDTAIELEGKLAEAYGNRKPLTPGPPTHGHAESNFLSVGNRRASTTRPRASVRTRYSAVTCSARS